MVFVYHGSDRGAGLVRWRWEHSWQGISWKQSQTNEAASIGTWLNKLKPDWILCYSDDRKGGKICLASWGSFKSFTIKTCYSLLAKIKCRNLAGHLPQGLSGSWTGSGPAEVLCILPESTVTTRLCFNTCAANDPKALLPLACPGFWPAKGNGLNGGEITCAQKGKDSIEVIV